MGHWWNDDSSSKNKYKPYLYRVSSDILLALKYNHCY